MDRSLTLMHAEYGIGYAATFATGLLVLLLFSLEKFDQPYPGRHLATLLPSDISGGSAYIRAFLMYFLLLSAFYAVGCLVVTGTPAAAAALGIGDPLPRDGMLAAAPVAGPLAVALVMVGLLPKFPQFGEVEARLRRLAHRAIGVPERLAEMEAYVSGLALDRNRFSPADRQSRAGILRLFLARQLALAPPGARAALEAWLAAGDAEAPMPSSAAPGLSPEDAIFLDALDEQVSDARAVAGTWYRAKYLKARLDNPALAHRLSPRGAAPRLSPLRDTLDKDYAALAAGIERIREDVKTLLGLLQALPAPAHPPAPPNDLGRYLDRLLDERLRDLSRLDAAVGDVLAKIHLLVSAAVILSPAGHLRSDTLRDLGLAEAPVPDSNADDRLLAIAVLAAAVLALNTAYLGWAGDPNPFGAAVRTAVSTVIVHGAGVWVGFARRAAGLRQGTWLLPFTGGAAVPMRQYLALAATAAVPAFMLLVGWTLLLFSAPTPPVGWSGAVLLALALSSMGAGVTALFTARGLDRADEGPAPLGRVASWALLQGAATALVAAIAAEQSGGLFPDVVATGFVAGCVLGASVRLSAGRPPAAPAFKPAWA